MEDPATPLGHNGIEEQMDDYSESGDQTNFDDTIAGADAETRSDKGNGRAWIEADGPTDYSLYSNPPSLAHIRQRLFDIDDSIEMSPADFEAYFPFVDNVWRKNKGDGAAAGAEGNATAEIYWCRLRKPTAQKPYVPKPTPEGKTARKKRIREEKMCSMAIKIVHKEGSVRSCNITRAVGPDVKHSHDLDYMDSIKRNTGIMDVARREAVKGFLPGSVYWKMQEEPVKLEAAGGKFLKISDVRNVQYAWRQDNMIAVLKAHRGYSQAGRANKPKVSSPAVATPTTKQPAQAAQPSQPPPLRQPPQAPAAPQQPQHPQHPQPNRPVFVPTPGVPATQGLSEASRTALQYPDHAREFLEPYLPRLADMSRRTRPHVTLTWATSLDARISLLPGMQTAISGPETKAMTHYLRSRHDAIVVGVRTAISDDPALNCRLAGSGGYGGPRGYGQPRPIIIDPHARLHIRPEMKVLRVVAEGRARGPWIVVAPGANLHPVAVATLKQYGGEYLMIQDTNPHDGRFNWEGIFDVLWKEGIKSVMVEGGGQVLSELLKPRYSNWIDSTILTIAPTFFGRAGTDVSPVPTMDQQQRPIATRLNNVRWQPMGDSDVVMCGQMIYDGPGPNGILPGIAEFSKSTTEQQKSAPPPMQNGHPAPPPA